MFEAAVRTESGGYQRLADFISTQLGPRGSGHMYTTEIIRADEELLECELGMRVLNYMLEKDIDGWDALLDASYDEYVRNDVHSSCSGEGQQQHSESDVRPTAGEDGSGFQEW